MSVGSRSYGSPIDTPCFGTFAQRPVAADSVVGLSYFATDNFKLYQCVSSAASTFSWVEIAVNVGGGSLAQTSWAVNPTTGDDNAVGTFNAPLKTLTEFFRRVNVNVGVINVAMTLQIQGDIPSTDFARSTIAFGPSGSLTMLGVAPTTLYTNNTAGFSARTNVNRATNTPPDVTDALLPGANDWATFITARARIRTTSGASSGAVAWPCKNLGARQARIFLPIIPNTAAAIVAQANVTVAATDQFVVETPTKIDNLDLNVMVYDQATVGVASYQFIVKDLSFTKRFNLATNDTTGEGATRIAFFGCDMGATSPTNGCFSYVDCRWSSFQGAPGTTHGFIGGGLVGTSFSFLGGCDAFLDLGFLSQGAQIFVNPGASIDLADCAAFDVTGAGVEADGCGSAFMGALIGSQALWGAGNSTFGYQQVGGTLQDYFSKAGATITGTTTDTKIGATNRTWAQIPFIASDIAAGSGTTFAGLVSR